MAATSTDAHRGARLLGLAWALVLAVLGLGALTIQFFGEPPEQQVLTLPLPHSMRQASTVRPATSLPPPVVYETPPGGILPATLSPAEQAAIAALGPQTTPQTGETAESAPNTAPAVVLPQIRGGLAVANPAVMEKIPQGFLPRISDSGQTPMQAYAAPSPPAGRPRIAIVIGGLGLSATRTMAAINTLPPQVTLAFAPYAADVQNWVALARQKGHEVLLQVPMEPYDFPDSDPGQYTLRSTVGEEANTRRLAWALTRFSGYVGVTNMLGGRFLSEAGPLEPVMTYLMRRGLLFYDNGAASHSVAPQVAQRLGAPFAQATNTLDLIQAALEIDHRLADLETEARTKGKAVGSGYFYPVTIDRVTLWARGVQSRGFVLAPISAIVSAAKK
jgi:uncharacterized protein